ncbi:hypothetical protein A7A76_06735 [Lysobacter enzymogenes]|uniref:hypothetical protein n=1 Tax=Lysobacter enzymogenes TaxID=69 RepID=UPI0019D2C7FB|nr:hypothetical protein [Lysobacter enzymogenes]MBN7138807.1 hypothetical protein [Lysobacter enzymogenes]
MGDPAKTVLGIHTNAGPGPNGEPAGLTDGHAWISVTRDGKTEVYGLWPNGHPRFANENPHPESNIRKGIEVGRGFEPTASRYIELSPEQEKKLDAALKEKVTWGYTNTCASWASDVTEKVTGQRISASELLGATGTPRQLYESINELEKKQPTAPDKGAPPLKPGEHGSSSLSAAEPAGPLKNAQDNAVYQAIRDKAPAEVPDAAVAYAVLKANQDAKITQPGEVAMVAVRDDKLFVAGQTPGHVAAVDLKQPIPAVADVDAQLAVAHGKAQAPQQAVAQEQQQQTSQPSFSRA